MSGTVKPTNATTQPRRDQEVAEQDRLDTLSEGEERGT
jgi:hypothetical protein